MTIQTLSGGLPDLVTAWTTVSNMTVLRPIRSEADFEQVSQLADFLTDTVGDDVSHPLYSMLELAMELIESWEDKHVKIPEVEPREVLRYLMETNGLKQKDLSDIVSQTLISDILSGRRDISKRLAKALSEKFNVEIGLFVS